MMPIPSCYEGDRSYKASLSPSLAEAQAQNNSVWSIYDATGTH